MAAFPNPEYYKKYNMGFSTANTPRIIFCGYDEAGYICIPRGLVDNLTRDFDAVGIKYQITDKRCRGKKIKVKFNGKLYPEQKIAVDKICKRDHGILSATTAFGKTVVGAKLIAKKKVNTLILIHNTEIMKNWLSDLEKFLEINEAPTFYETPTGRKKQHKSPIGKITSTVKRPTGIIDVAMISSLGKPEAVNQIVNDYGMVIMDECHHGPSKIAEAVIKETKAKYLYGFTATPKRNDDQDKKLFMDFGSILHKYTAKDRMLQTGIEQKVVVRNTEFSVSDPKMAIQDIYKLLISDTNRNSLIIDDATKLYSDNKSILIVTKFKKQANLLFSVLKTDKDNVFLLTGDLKPKERDTVRQKLDEVPAAEPVILIATGQYIGEGFNYPRLEVMLLATPIAWEGNVEQYAGRLHRNYPGKESVAIYDYIDENVPVLKRMYSKRLRAYRKIGYEVA